MINIQSFKKLRTLVPSMLLAALFVAGCSSSNVGDTGADQMPDMPKTPQVAMFGDQTLGLEEFEDEYARSVGGRDIAAADSMPMYTEFLDRYVDFRLKVLYAKDIGLDQDSTLLSEIDTYRNQLARPYLLEKEILDPILRDLYVRKQNMVDASHILVRAGQGATPEELETARIKMETIRDSIEMGIDFNELAFRNSEDPSARGQRSGAMGRLGYFVGGQMVKPFEDRAYTTPIDSVSEVFRTDFGYHIMKIHDRRAKVADVWASHIAVRYFKPSSLDSLDSEGRIAQIKMRLDAGEDFATLAKEESEDLDSGSRGGQIGRLRFTQPGMPDAFKDALFALENPGDYSDVVKTEYGYHIIKLDKRQATETFEEAYDELKNHASRLPRLRKAENAMAMQIREKYGVSVDTTLTLEILDGRHFGVPNILQTPANQLNMEIASLGDETFTFREVVTFVETASIPFQPDTLGLVYDALERFLNDEALNYEAARLESRDDSFKQILDEFKNGLLLFKLMEDSVWTAAAQDTAGLMKYHAPRADSFWFEDRTRIVSFRAQSDSVLNTLATKLDEGTALNELVSMAAMDSTMMVRVDTTFLVGPNKSVFDRALALESGDYVSPTRHSNGFLLMINDGIAPARKKSFDEARSEVLNGYQTELENALLDRLRDKYGIKKMPAPLSGAFAEDKAILMKEKDLFDNKTQNAGQ
ncbi:MAG: peptidylprolyl isomerase [Bacteroidota bacterium]